MRPYRCLTSCGRPARSNPDGAEQVGAEDQVPARVVLLVEGRVHREPGVGETSMCRPPSSLTVRATAASTEVVYRTSAWIAIARRPTLRTCSAVSSSSAAVPSDCR
jgi:hypothetical protein